MSENLSRREIIAWLQKPRTGWVIRWISQEVVETVLYHTKKVAQAARLYASHFPSLDAEKLVLMALYHDIAEFQEKDYPPGEISLEEKHKREMAVVEKLRDYFWRWEEIYRIWSEYEERKTEESIIIKQLDIMDTWVQALEYYCQGYTSVSDFFGWLDGKLMDDLLRKIWWILIKNRFSHISQNTQYMLLLEFAGDEEKFNSYMRLHYS